MSSLARAFGWRSPKTKEDTISAAPPIPSHPSTLTLMGLQVPVPQPSDDVLQLPSGRSSPIALEPASPASSTSSLSQEGEGDSNQAAEPVRRGDPAWVARPRNPFIIFRCEYSRTHTREGKRVRRPPGSQAEKTLSKRAAEAWHQLPSEEKNRFKELAEEEKKKHAELYPHYRFRPMRRNVKKPNSQTSPAKGSSQASSVKSPASSVADVSMPPPELPSASAQPEASEMASTLPPLPSVPTDMSAVKGNRRRSASVPSLPFGQHPFISGVWASPSPRLAIKRSRSAMGNRPSMAGAVSSNAFDPRYFETSSGSSVDFYTPEGQLTPPLDIDPEYPFGKQFTSQEVNIPPQMFASSSSLASWDGQPPSVAPLMTASNASPWGSPPSVDHYQDGSSPSYTDYQPIPGEEELALALANYTQINDPWMAPAQPSFAPMGVATVAESAPSFQQPAPSSYDTRYEFSGSQSYDVATYIDTTQLGETTAQMSDEAFYAQDMNTYFQTY